MVSDGTARPYRVKIKSPDYASLQAIHSVEGHYIADVVAIIGSLDVVFEVSIDNSVVFSTYVTVLNPTSM
jgi:NADH:ubiquinone oxidoreductase subunit D